MGYKTTASVRYEGGFGKLPKHTCYHVKFRSFASNGVYVNRRDPKNCEC